MTTALLLVMGLCLRAFSCGPEFPNWLLDDGDEAILRTPEAYFQYELARMGLVTTTNVARVSDDPQKSTIATDLADLKKALEAALTPAEKVDGYVARYREVRLKTAELASAALDSNAPVALSAWPAPPLGLPAEFADYFRGAIAWHQTNLQTARKEWLTLLNRQPAERRYRSTWAAYMLGRSWETEDAQKAIGWYQEVRKLSQSGYSDSLGLAVESMGWEARLHWVEKRHARAIELYLLQHAAGDPTALNSLKFVAEDALLQGRKVLDPLAKHPKAQRLVTAYVISGGYRQPPIDIDGPVTETALLVWSKAAAKWAFVSPPTTAWHTLREPAKLWLEAVESARVRDVDSAEQLALAAYQAGEMETARRWLDRASPTTAAQWLRAKLHLRDGKVAEAKELLAKVAAALPLGVQSASNSTRTLAGGLYVDAGGYYGQVPATAAEAARGELAVTQLSGGRYIEALDSLMQSSPAYWMDAAYVAERILSIEELKAYVDRKFPTASPAPKLDVSDPNDGSQKPEQPETARPREYTGTNALRYLLARRLARSYRFSEARQYYPTEWLPVFDQLSTAWQTAEDGGKSLRTRGEALVEGAVLSRKYGLELLGTEVEPDWRVHAGNFEEGIWLTARAALTRPNVLTAESEELQKGARHRVWPEQRWHYRVVAGAMGFEAAMLLRDDASGQSPSERAHTLMTAAKKLADAGISMPVIYQSMSDKPAIGVHNEADDPGPTMAGKVHQRLVSWCAASLPAAKTNSLPSHVFWEARYTSAALAWEAAQGLPNNSEETARVLCLGGAWISGDPPIADIFYKALVRRCRKTSIGAEADRIRWFPRLDQQGKLVSRKAEVDRRDAR